MYDTNELHEAERQESRSARYGLRESERVAGCQHLGARGTTCGECGEDPT